MILLCFIFPCKKPAQQKNLRAGVLYSDYFSSSSISTSA